MATTRLDIAYYGAGFRGWAAQPGLRTVQGDLEAAMAALLHSEVSLSVAGRTDAGVHAWGQVASFAAAPLEGLAHSLNGLLGNDVAVTAASETDNGFDARRDALSRTYCYRILARSAPDPFEQGRALWWPQRLDRDALDACAESLAGSHDFTASTQPRPSTCASSGRSAGPSGFGRTSSARFGLEPTPSCARWLAAWSGRCSRSPRGPQHRGVHGAARWSAARAGGETPPPRTVCIWRRFGIDGPRNRCVGPRDPVSRQVLVRRRSRRTYLERQTAS